MLHRAALAGRLESCVTLLHLGSEVDAQDRAGMTPLLLAASTGHTDVCKALVEAGARTDHVSHNGSTALHIAANHSRADAVSYLCSVCPLAVQCTSGFTALHVASMCTNESVCTALLDAGVPTAAVDKSGRTALHVAVMLDLVGICRILVARGCKVDAVDSVGCTPLHYAGERNDVGVASVLVDAGADVDAKNGDGCTPLHVAASHHAEMCEFLVGSKASMGIRNKRDLLPLHVAVLEKNSEVVDFLASTRTHLESVYNGLTPLCHAANLSDVASCISLSAAGASLDGVLQVGYSYDFDVMRVLHADMTTLLRQAAKRDLVHACHLVLATCVSVDDADDYGRTALHYAAGRLGRCVELLVSYRADPNRCDIRDRTPLHAAVRVRPNSTMRVQDICRVCRTLVGAGADVEMLDCHRMSPRHYACHPSVRAALVGSGN